MVQLTNEEKAALCARLASHLAAIRRLLHLSQARFGELAGISRARIIHIENGTMPLSWGQLTSVLFVCVSNRRSKEYLYANNVLGPRFLQYMQQLDANIPPRTNLCVHEGILRGYREDMDALRTKKGSTVQFSKEERRAFCRRILERLPELRRVLRLSQALFAELAGISRARLIQLEKHKVSLSWSQMTSILFVCLTNLRGKEYLYANKVLSVEFLQYVQQKDAGQPPETNLCVPEALILSYDEFLNLAETHAAQTL